MKMKWNCFFERIWNDKPEEEPWSLCRSSGSAIHHPGPASLGRWPGAPPLKGSQPGLGRQNPLDNPQGTWERFVPGQAMFLWHLHRWPLQLPKFIQGRDSTRRLRGRVKDRTGRRTQHLSAHGKPPASRKKAQWATGDRAQTVSSAACLLTYAWQEVLGQDSDPFSI